MVRNPSVVQFLKLWTLVHLLYTSKLNYVLQLIKNMSRVMGQNSPTS